MAARYRAECVEAAMRDVDDAQHAKDQAEPDRDQEDKGGVGQPIEARQHEQRRIHRGMGSIGGARANTVNRIGPSLLGVISRRA